MADRDPISKSTRFQIFRRDKFTCQYCGQKAPDVTLVIDHIYPVASGGTDHPSNLITACTACNAGKGDKPLCEEDLKMTDAERSDPTLKWYREASAVRHVLLRRLKDRNPDEIVRMMERNLIERASDSFTVAELLELAYRFDTWWDWHTALTDELDTREEAYYKKCEGEDG